MRGVFGVTVRLMSDGELARLEVLRDLDQRRLSVKTAAQLLGLERRQVFRLVKAYRSEGATGLISKRRGRASNRRDCTGLSHLDQGVEEYRRLSPMRLSPIRLVLVRREV